MTKKKAQEARDAARAAIAKLNDVETKPHRVTLPKGHPRGDVATYHGLPPLKAGETVTLDLTEAQVASLKRKGIKVTGGVDAGKE